jgi:hypothetical protein
MNKQILENRLIDSVALVIMGNQLASEVTCSETSPALKSEIKKSLTFTRAFLRTGNTKKLFASNWT